jgi:predicted RNA binding protein YcfA (HicA-like mRNA interferase family)
VTRLYPVSAKKIQKLLQNLGFVLDHQKGSHQIWKHPDGRSTVLPVHAGQDLGKGLIRAIINEIGISMKDYFQQL